MIITYFFQIYRFELRFVSAAVSYESLPKLSRVFKDSIAYRLLQRVREGKSSTHLVINAHLKIFLKRKKSSCKRRTARGVACPLVCVCGGGGGGWAAGGGGQGVTPSCPEGAGIPLCYVWGVESTPFPVRRGTGQWVPPVLSRGGSTPCPFQGYGGTPSPVWGWEGGTPFLSGGRWGVAPCPVLSRGVPLSCTEGSGGTPLSCLGGTPPLNGQTRVKT